MKSFLIPLLFVGLIGVAGACEPDLSPKDFPCLTLIERNGHVELVATDGWLINEFVEAYQTILWPDWRTADGEAAENLRTKMEDLRREYWKSKQGLVNSQGPLCDDAVWGAVRQMHKRGHAMDIRTRSRH